jgi:hypothetical protein
MELVKQGRRLIGRVQIIGLSNGLSVDNLMELPNTVNVDVSSVQAKFVNGRFS